MPISGGWTGTAGGGGWRTAWRRASTSLARLRFVFADFDLPQWLNRQWEREAEARSAFFALPVGMMVGIALIYGTGWRPSAALCFLAAAMSAALAIRSSTRLAAFAGAVTFAFLGAALSVVEIGRLDTIIFSGEATVRVEGRVLWRDYDDRGRYRYLVAIDRSERPTLSRPPQRAEILVSSKHVPLPIGQRYTGLVRLRPPSGPAYPGGYDFAFGKFFERLGAYGYALGPPGPAAANDVVSLSASERLTDLRLWISDRIRDVIGGGEGAVASAIITGERTGIPDDIENWLRVTGLSHVLSISGVHMALAAGFAMMLVRGFCALSPGIALRVSSKKIAAWTALAISAGYLALSGADVAATRSFIMIAIMLVAVIFDRSALTLRNVALAALIVLAITPHALLTASFQMSFAATAAIIAIYGDFARRFQSASHGQRRGLVETAALWLVGIAVSSTIAGLATAPYAAFHFQRIAPFGLAANMLALPIFSFWIMPLALLAMLAMPFGYDAPFLWLLGKGLAAVFHVAKTLAAYMPDEPTGLLAVTGVVTLTAALLIGCFLSSRLRFVSIPVAALGLVMVIDRSERPELLIFEDGREIALVDEAGQFAPLKTRPNRFVLDQWERAFPAAGTTAAQASFECETIEDDGQARTRPVTGSPDPKAEGGRTRKPRQYRFCKASTRSGLRVVWTDDYRLLDRACAEADLAIVARAIRASECGSSATLLTLRTLRVGGSVAVFRSEDRRPLLRASIDRPDEEWNAHRLAPWPERWRREEGTAAQTQSSVTHSQGSYQAGATAPVESGTLSTCGSGRPACPAP